MSIFNSWPHAVECFETAGLHGQVPALQALARPTVAFVGGDGSGEIAIGATKIGGAPDLAAHLSWPERSAYANSDELVERETRIAKFRLDGHSSIAFRREVEEELEKFQCRVSSPAPLSLVMQVDLEAALKTGSLDPALPSTGRLLWFYDLELQPWGFDPHDGPGSRLIWDETPANELRRKDVALNHDFPPMLVGERALVPRAGLTLPPWEATSMEVIFGTLEQRKTDPDLEEMLDRYLAACPKREPDHRLGGWPNQIQGDMALECQLVTNGLYCGDSSAYQNPRRIELEPGAKDWRLVLQLDSDDQADGIMWGDCGRLYCWMRTEDIRQRKFERAWTVLQCY